MWDDKREKYHFALKANQPTSFFIWRLNKIGRYAVYTGDFIEGRPNTKLIIMFMGKAHGNKKTELNYRIFDDNQIEKG